MRKRTFRAWSKKDRIMLYGIEQLPNFAEVWNSEDYVKMEMYPDADKLGNPVYEGDYLGRKARVIQTCFEYEIGLMAFDEYRLVTGLRQIKARKAYHDKWEDERKREYAETFYQNGLGRRGYEVLGNMFETPEIPESYRPDFSDSLEKTGVSIEGFGELRRYDILHFPNKPEYDHIAVVDFNKNYSENAGTYYLRPFNNPWHHKFVGKLLTQEAVAGTKVVGNASTDTFDHKAYKIFLHTS